MDENRHEPIVYIGQYLNYQVLDIEFTNNITDI